jgi:hypothetical protein
VRTCRHQNSWNTAAQVRRGRNTHEAAGEVADEDLEEARPPSPLLLLHGGRKSADRSPSPSIPLFLRRREATETTVRLLGSAMDELEDAAPLLGDLVWLCGWVMTSAESSRPPACPPALSKAECHLEHGLGGFVLDTACQSWKRLHTSVTSAFMSLCGRSSIYWQPHSCKTEGMCNEMMSCHLEFLLSWSYETSMIGARRCNIHRKARLVARLPAPPNGEQADITKIYKKS